MSWHVFDSVIWHCIIHWYITVTCHSVEALSLHRSPTHCWFAWHVRVTLVTGPLISHSTGSLLSCFLFLYSSILLLLLLLLLHCDVPISFTFLPSAVTQRTMDSIVSQHWCFRCVCAKEWVSRFALSSAHTHRVHWVTLVHSDSTSSRPSRDARCKKYNNFTVHSLTTVLPLSFIAIVIARQLTPLQTERETDRQLALSMLQLLTVVLKDTRCGSGDKNCETFYSR